MLPKSKRIPRELFKELLSSRKYSNSPHFSLRSSPNPLSEARISVSVSKKVSKKATVRNKIRRRVYSSTRTLLNEMQGGLYLFIAKPGAEKIQGRDLANELAELIKKG